jgi:hypothetical protein
MGGQNTEIPIRDFFANHTQYTIGDVYKSLKHKTHIVFVTIENKSNNDVTKDWSTVVRGLLIRFDDTGKFLSFGETYKRQSDDMEAWTIGHTHQTEEFLLKNTEHDEMKDSLLHMKIQVPCLDPSDSNPIDVFLLVSQERDSLLDTMKIPTWIWFHPNDDEIMYRKVDQVSDCGSFCDVCGQSAEYNNNGIYWLYKDLYYSEYAKKYMSFNAAPCECSSCFDINRISKYSEKKNPL